MTARRAVVLAAFALLATAPGCGVYIASERDRLLDTASAAVAADLEAVLRSAREAAAALGPALAEAATGADRFAAAEEVRARFGVDGLAWDGPGESAWAGRTLDPVGDPPRPPWRQSFRRGDVLVHLGPYVSAIVVGPLPAAGGSVTTVVLLEERTPTDVSPRFARRWAKRLGLDEVRIVPADADPAGDPERSRRVLVPAADPALAAVMVSPDDGALVGRAAARQRTRVGTAIFFAWAAALAAALVFATRRRRTGPGRWWPVALLFLVFRTALAALDLPERFPFLRPGFSSADFGVEGWLGWFASPSDFALSALTFLLAAMALAADGAAIAPRRTWTRATVLLGGTIGTAAVAVAWSRLLELAVSQAQTRFFAVRSFVPPIPEALLLLALVASVAAAWLLAVTLLRAAVRAEALPGGFSLAASSLGALALAIVLAEPGVLAVAAGLVVLAAVPFSRPPQGAALAFPSRLLLGSVLAVAVLFWPLWALVGEQRAKGLADVLDDLLRAEASARSNAWLDVTAAAEDDEVVAALVEAQAGPRPEGLALHVWRQSTLAYPGEHGAVHVLDPEGRILDRFSLTPVPGSWVPAPAPPAEGAPNPQVVAARGSGGSGIRSVVARAWVAAPDGELVGALVLTVPDRVDLALRGLSRREGPDDAAAPRSVEVATLERGRVVASSSPTVSRREGGFGPPEIATLGPERPEIGWGTRDEEGRAAWSEERGLVVAVRRPRAGLGDAVLALARLVMVGVGFAALVALFVFAAGLRGFRPRLQHRILLSYFGISVLPLVLLGWASAAEVRGRHEADLEARLQQDVGRVRSDLEAMGPQLFDLASEDNLVRWASQRRHDIVLYRQGLVHAASRPGLVETELLPSRLPPDAYRATIHERRERIGREASFLGAPVWFGYAPVLDDAGRPTATLAIPLLYEAVRVDEQLAVTGSVLLASYLLTLVLVLVGGILAARRLTRPLALLAEGTKRVAEGDFAALPQAGSGELGELVDAFNRMTEDLRKATAQAVENERLLAWRRMARQVAHEIKNPLTPMRLMIQQLEADVARDPAGAREAIRRTSAVVLKQIDALGRIAGDFATFARWPERRIAPVDVGQLVGAVADLYRGSAAEGVEVTSEVTPPLPAVAWDAGELRRVLLNLVGNAVQAIVGPGRVSVVARAESREGREGVRVEVVDTGTGIAPEHLRRVFEPDFTTKPGGTGLGLAIVRRSLDDMGGDIEVESEVGRGSAFRMWWPAAPAPPGGASAGS
jgi:signal transduction histidine kinase